MKDAVSKLKVKNSHYRTKSSLNKLGSGRKPKFTFEVAPTQFRSPKKKKTKSSSKLSDAGYYKVNHPKAFQTQDNRASSGLFAHEINNPDDLTLALESYEEVNRPLPTEISPKSTKYKHLSSNNTSKKGLPKISIYKTLSFQQKARI